MPQTTARPLPARLLPALTLAATFAAPAAFAATPAPITGVTVTTTATTCCTIANIVNGSGLSAYLPTATHEQMFSTNALLVQSMPAQFTFNLNGTWLISELAFWNLNGGNPTLGIKDVSISWSFDGINFAVIPGAPTQFAQAAASNSTNAERFSFSRAASYVRFDILSNWNGSSFSSFGEVMFVGVPTAVPEPASAALMLAGAAALAGTALARRRAARRG